MWLLMGTGTNLGGDPFHQGLSRIGNHAEASPPLQMPPMDPMYLQYLRMSEYAAHMAASYGATSLDKGYMNSNSYVDAISQQNIQKAYMKQYGMAFQGNKQGYYGNSYPLTSPILPGSPVGSGSPIRHNDRFSRFPSGVRNIGGGVLGSYLFDEGFASSLLEEFKSNKTKCFELSEISGHVVEFRYPIGILICSLGIY